MSVQSPATPPVRPVGGRSAERGGAARRSRAGRRPILLGNPLLLKELRTRMRGWRTAATITVYLLILSLLAIAVLSVTLNSSSFTMSSAASLGAGLFALLSLFQMFLLLFVTPASAATAISGERQRQTLDLLLVTGLSTPGIVLGKLCAALSFDVLLLLCALPLFSIVFLFGGVAPEQLAAAYALFLSTVVVLGSASLCISTLTRRSQASSILSNIFAFALTFGLVLLTIFLAASRQPSPPVASMGVTTPPGPPWTVYIDPVFGLLYLLPAQFIGSTLYGLGTPAPFLGLPLEVWQYNVIVDLVLAALCILISLATLRRAS